EAGALGGKALSGTPRGSSQPKETKIKESKKNVRIQTSKNKKGGQLAALSRISERIRPEDYSSTVVSSLMMTESDASTFFPSISVIRNSTRRLSERASRRSLPRRPLISALGCDSPNP